MIPLSLRSSRFFLKNKIGYFEKQKNKYFSTFQHVNKKIPVTVLSGFLGAGKTTLVNRILAEPNGKKFGLIVNDMASVNIDAKQVSKTTYKNNNSIQPDTIELENGCVCCTLSDSLFSSIMKLQDMALGDGSDESEMQPKLDHIIVECSGIAEPKKIRDFFFEATDVGLELIEKVNLDTLITVIDSAIFIKYFGSNDSLEDHKDLALSKGDQNSLQKDPMTNESHLKQRSITQLLLEQVECADVVLINKCDLITSNEIAFLRKLILGLNPTVLVLECVRSQPFQLKDPLELIGSAGGQGASSKSLLDEHNDLLRQALEEERDASNNYSHSCSHNHESCTHDHSHSHNHESCTHDHSHSHNHESGTHDHSHSHCESNCTLDHSHSHCESNCTLDHSHTHNHSHESTTAEKYYNITSFVYKRYSPFHPERISSLLESIGTITKDGAKLKSNNNSKEYNLKDYNILRSKGFMWLASSESTTFLYSHAGDYVEVNDIGQWWASTPKEDWPEHMIEEIEMEFEEGLKNISGEVHHGDRRQELVFIGQLNNLIKEDLISKLDKCLLTPEEMKRYNNLQEKGDIELQKYFSNV